MCGIAGIYDLNNREASNLQNSLGLMNKLLKHRGPDHSGFWIITAKTLGFSHNRFSIIDLTNSSQCLQIQDM